jgi:hypothetical protein
MRKNISKILFASLKKGVGSGSIDQRYRFGDPDPDPHQNVTDPQHWKICKKNLNRILFDEVGTLMDFPNFFVLYFVDLHNLQHF